MAVRVDLVQDRASPRRPGEGAGQAASPVAGGSGDEPLGLVLLEAERAETDWVAARLAALAARSRPLAATVAPVASAGRMAWSPVEAPRLSAWQRQLFEQLRPGLHGAGLPSPLTGASLPATLNALVLVEGDGAPRLLGRWRLRGERVTPGLEREDVFEGFDAALALGHFFLAHEVLEGLWRREHDRGQQIAIWIAAAFHHNQRGNPVGVRRLMDKIAAAGPPVGDELGNRVREWQRTAVAGAPLAPLTANDRRLIYERLLGAACAASPRRSP